MIPGRFILVVGLISTTLSSCYAVNFFKKKKKANANQGIVTRTGGVLGQPLGNTAGVQNDAALAELYAISTSVPPAVVRPDPDVMVRKLLRQFRPEGSTLAREIGRVETYRLLLGGASEDFQTAPQETYDATSLLANLKVAEEICESLVAPAATSHPGWVTILPAPPGDTTANLRYLAQRFTGIPSAKISDETLNSLHAIMDNAAGGGPPYTERSYIPPCATLALDARSLHL